VTGLGLCLAFSGSQLTPDTPFVPDEEEPTLRLFKQLTSHTTKSGSLNLGYRVIAHYAGWLKRSTAPINHDSSFSLKSESLLTWVGRGYGPDPCRFSWKTFLPRENTDIDCERQTFSLNRWDLPLKMSLRWKSCFKDQTVFWKTFEWVNFTDDLFVMKSFIIISWWSDFFQNEISWLVKIEIFFFGCWIGDWSEKWSKGWWESKRRRLMFFLLMNFHENCFKAFTQSNLMFQSESKKTTTFGLRQRMFLSWKIIHKIKNENSSFHEYPTKFVTKVNTENVDWWKQTFLKTMKMTYLEHWKFFFRLSDWLTSLIMFRDEVFWKI